MRGIGKCGFYRIWIDGEKSESEEEEEKEGEEVKEVPFVVVVVVFLGRARLHRRCCGGPPPWLADPPLAGRPLPGWHENVMDGWGARPLR